MAEDKSPLPELLRQKVKELNLLLERASRERLLVDFKVAQIPIVTSKPLQVVEVTVYKEV